MKRSTWFGWGRSAGRWGFMLHRASGLALTLYLGIHLALLGQLRAGPGRWDAFVRLASSPTFLLLDALLFGAAAFHGFNGLRLTILGLGWAVDRQKELLWVSVALAAALTATVGIAMILG
jgi:succinate dehydrogenase / fumarate reductase cytochrome b subunit